MKRILSTVALASAFIFSPAIVQAGVGDPCTVTNKIYEVEGPSTPSLICNGTTLEILQSAKTGPLAKGIRTNDPQTPLDVNGEIKIGASTGLACDANRDGAIRYDSTTKIIQLCNGATWGSVNLGCDATPDGFDFSDVTGVALSSTQSSSIEQMTGITCAVTVSISGTGSPQYRTCSDATCTTEIATWSSSNGSISNNEYLQVRVTASPNSLEVRTATVNVGGAVDSYSATTLNAGTFKRVFVHMDEDGDMGGIAAADALCQADADTEGLGGTYLAWLAIDGTDDPATRFTQATVEYRLTDGTKIANDWTDLVDGGALQSNIYTNADGSSIAYSDSVWTNVGTDGIVYSSTNNCTGWTTNGSGASSRVGHSNVTGAGWTNNGVSHPCNNTNHIFCFEQ